MPRVKALLCARRAHHYASLMPPLPQEVEVIPCTGDEEALAHLDADAVACWSHEPPRAFLARSRIRWVHALSAGVEGLLTPELLNGPITVTNSRGTNAPPIAEHVISLMLAFSRQLHRWIRQQAQGVWAPSHRESFELSGLTVGVVGLGEIGREVAVRAAALGMRVLGLRRSAVTGSAAAPAPPPAGVERVLPPEALADLLSESDFVVLAVPLTAETRGWVDAAALARMKPTAYLINVARGPVVDEPALIAALQTGQIAGAGLDVFAEEPLPAGSPLWQMPQVIITPHVSAASPRIMVRGMALWAENLRRFARGESLLNLVNKQRGY